MEPAERTITAFENEDEFEPPSYNEPGRILFRCLPTPNEEPEIEIIDYDGCAFWLNEGGFPDYTVRDITNIELEGYYCLEGVSVYGHKDYFGEYDEDWDFAFCRRADDVEVQTLALR